MAVHIPVFCISRDAARDFRQVLCDGPIPAYFPWQSTLEPDPLAIRVTGAIKLGAVPFDSWVNLENKWCCSHQNVPPEIPGGLPSAEYASEVVAAWNVAIPTDPPPRLMSALTAFTAPVPP